MSEYAGQNKIAELVFCIILWVLPAIVMIQTVTDLGMCVFAFTCITGICFTAMQIILGEKSNENTQPETI